VTHESRSGNRAVGGTDRAALSFGQLAAKAPGLVILYCSMLFRGEEWGRRRVSSSSIPQKPEFVF